MGEGVSDEFAASARRLGLFRVLESWFKGTNFRVGTMHPETWSKDDLVNLGLKLKSGPNDFSLTHIASNSGIDAHLNSVGSFSCEMRRNAGSPISGKEMFDAAMTHFGDRVRTIAAHWAYGSNLKKVNQLVAEGVPLRQAVTRTWTAGRAAEYGFTYIYEVLTDEQTLFEHIAEPDDMEGAYKVIKVTFGRPPG